LKEARIRGVTDAESVDDILGQAASGKVFASSGTFGTAEALLEKCNRTLVDFDQHRTQLGFLCFSGTAVAKFGKRNPELLGHRSHSFREGDIFDLLDEAKDVSRNATSKTVKELAGSVDGKRRRFFVVEGAKPREILRPGLLELDVVANDADDIRLLLNDFFEIFNAGHGWKTQLSLGIVSQKTDQGNLN
jgi:hypothetical protein